MNPGPVHLNVVPGVDEVAVIVRVCPVQIGALLVMTTFAGELGLVSVKGPTTFEIHPFRVTVMFLYSPAESLSMMMVPVTVDLAFNEILLPEGLVY